MMHLIISIMCFKLSGSPNREEHSFCTLFRNRNQSAVPATIMRSHAVTYVGDHGLARQY